MHPSRFALLLLVLVLPVAADWIDIRDGRRENEGDWMEVINQLDGNLKFALWAAGRDDQACRLRGVAQKQGPGVYLYQEQSSQCVLRISAQDERLVAEDLGDYCRSLYCPQKASIGVRSFKLAAPLPLTDKINGEW